MSVGNDQSEAGPDSTDLSAEIDKTMAEAEAAVSALDPDDPDGLASGSPPNPNPGPQAEVQELRREVESIRDKWLRAMADLENLKKRTKREIDESVTRSAQQLLSSFLPVVDNLERALEAGAPGPDPDDSKFKQLLAGIDMVRGEFLSALGRQGIEPVPSVGLPFDPAFHDALQQMDSPDHPPGVIIREFERGYRLGSRLLRPARVVVAGAGSTGTTGETTEN